MNEYSPADVAQVLANTKPVQECIADLIRRYPEDVLRDAALAMLIQFTKKATSVPPAEAAAIFASAIVSGGVEPQDWDRALDLLPERIEKNKGILRQLGGKEGPARA